MPYDPGLVARIASVLDALGARGTRQKNVFGGRGFLVGSTTFVVVWDDGVIVKVPAGEYAAALAEPGVAPFQPDGARAMSTWVVVPAESVADDPELHAWVERGLRAVP